MSDSVAFATKALLSALLISIIVINSGSSIGAPRLADADSGDATSLLQQTQGICGLTHQASELAQLIINDSEQQHPRLQCNTLLTSIAQVKAQQMADQQLITHFGQGGANRRLRDAGYRLPDNYPNQFANQVESVAGGSETPQKMWQVFKTSRHHRAHLLGELPFFRQQNEIGVGFVHAPDSAHVYYWVVYIAAQSSP